MEVGRISFGPRGQDMVSVDLLKPMRQTCEGSEEVVRQFYITRESIDNGGADLVIGIDGATHVASFGAGMPVADAVQRLRELADQLERGAIRRMENQQ